MSDRFDMRLREAKPSPGGGILLAVVSWIKEHVPFVLRPVDFADAKIDVDRARAELLRNEALKRGAEAELISAHATALRTKTMLLLAGHSPATVPPSSGRSGPAIVPDDAIEVLEAAIRRLEGLSLPVDMNVIKPRGELPPAVPEGAEEMDSI
jgi:hypothetical protein